MVLLFNQFNMAIAIFRKMKDKFAPVENPPLQYMGKGSFSAAGMPNNGPLFMLLNAEMNICEHLVAPGIY